MSGYGRIWFKWRGGRVVGHRYHIWCLLSLLLWSGLLSVVPARAASQDTVPPEEETATPMPPSPVNANGTSSSASKRRFTLLGRRESGALMPLEDVQVRIAGANAATEVTDATGTVELALADTLPLTLQFFVASKPTCKLILKEWGPNGRALRIELAFETVAEKRICKTIRLPATSP